MTHDLPRHDLPHLYKYTSAETAKKVISTQRFRWSSPIKFNDPFDHQTGFVFDFTRKQLADSLTGAAELAIFGDAPFDPPVSTEYGDTLRHMRAIRQKLPRTQVMTDLSKASAEIASNFSKHIKRLNTEVISLLPHSKVLRLPTAPDNVVMWSHYASDHRGAIFKLRLLEERDRRLLDAQRVVYTNEPLTYMGLDAYVEHLLGTKYQDPVARIWEIAYRKHRDWAYEQEWRIHIPLLNEPAGDGFAYYDEPKELFEAIYLGCRMEPNTRAETIDLVTRHMPKTEIFNAKKVPGRMKLDFERVR